MAYVLTNGCHYIRMTETGRVVKTKNINEAQIYPSTGKAKEGLLKAPGKTVGYYIVDVETNTRYRLRSNGRINFPVEVRQLIYDTAEGRCVLCGRRISYDKMTLDHIVPLSSMNGDDDVSNLQCTCDVCNQFKGSVLPDDFLERITDIFLYQMDKKYGKKLFWKIIHRQLSKKRL